MNHASRYLLMTLLATAATPQSTPAPTSAPATLAAPTSQPTIQPTRQLLCHHQRECPPRRPRRRRVLRLDARRLLLLSPRERRHGGARGVHAGVSVLDENQGQTNKTSGVAALILCRRTMRPPNHPHPSRSSYPCRSGWDATMICNLLRRVLNQKRRRA
jgi:hypothetical protein